MWRHNTESPFETKEQKHVSWTPHLSDFFVSQFIIIATLNLLSISDAQERSGEITLEQYLDQYDPIGALRETYTHSSLEESLTHIRSQIDQDVGELLHERIDAVYERSAHISEDVSDLPEDVLRCAIERYRRLQILHRQYAHKKHTRDVQICFLIEHILPSVRRALTAKYSTPVLWKKKNAHEQKLYEIFNRGLVGQSETQKQQTQLEIRSFLDAPFVWTLVHTLSPIHPFIDLDLEKEMYLHDSCTPFVLGAHVRVLLDGYSFTQDMHSSDEILSVGCILPRGAKQVSVCISGSFDVQLCTEKTFVYICDVDVFGANARSKRGIRLWSGQQKQFSKKMTFSVSTDVDTSFMFRVDVSGFRMAAEDVRISVVTQ